MTEKRESKNQTDDAKKFLFEEESLDFDNDDLDNEFDDFEDDEEDKVRPLVATGIFLGLIILAAIICAIAWNISHGDDKDESVRVTETVQEENLDATVESESSDSENPDDVVENETSDNEAVSSEPGVNETIEDATAEVGDTGDLTGENDSGNAETAENEAVEENIVDSEPAEPISGTESMEFTEVADTVTAKDVTNLRSVPSTLDAENVVAQLLNGETLSRTGVNDATGWSRLNYNGQTVYAVSGFLTTDLNYKPPVAPSDPNRITTQDGRVIIFTDCDDYITPKEYVNLRIEPSTSQGEATAKCQISNGTVVHRTGYSPDSGWSRVEYNGEVLYVVSSFVYNTEAAQ